MTREEAIERFENVKANALVQKASGVSEYWQNEIDGTIEAIDMAIEALQTDLVRCNECKHYRAEYGSCTAEHWDLSRVTFPHVEPNDYCSYGEKKK